MNKSTNEQTAQEAEGETQLQHPIESHRIYLSVCALPGSAAEPFSCYKYQKPRREMLANSH